MKVSKSQSSEVPNLNVVGERVVLGPLRKRHTAFTSERM